MAKSPLGNLDLDPWDAVYEKTKVRPVKICVIGDSGTGKTSLIDRYVNSRFEEQHGSTIGAAFFRTTVNYLNYTFVCNIWDTAGSLNYRSILPNFLRCTDVFLIVFDITDRKSFQNIYEWIDLIRQRYDKDDVIVFMCGNKLDLLNDREVSEEEANALSDEKGMIFYEVSALNGNGIGPLFTRVGRLLREKEEGRRPSEPGIRRPSEPIILTHDTLKKKKSCCK